MSQTSVASVEVLASELNGQGGMVCPSPSANMAVWSSHPKVTLDVGHSGQATCPYCGTRYKLKDGEHFAAGH